MCVNHRTRFQYKNLQPTMGSLFEPSSPERKSQTEYAGHCCMWSRPPILCQKITPIHAELNMNDCLL